MEKQFEGISFNKANVKAAIETLGGKEKFIEVAKKKYWTAADGVNEAAQLKRIEAGYAWVMEEPKAEAPKSDEKKAKQN